MLIYCRSALARDGVPSVTEMPLTHRNSRASALLQGISIGPKDTPRTSRRQMPLILISIHKRLRHRRTRLGCRLNAGLAQWAEPHGCGESVVRTWMSVRRGPTERDRSEGTLTKEGPNQEQAPLVTWGAFPSNSPKAKCSAVRQSALAHAAPINTNKKGHPKVA